MLKKVQQKGLSPQDVLAARAEYGWNKLPAVKQTGPWRIYLRQFPSFWS